MIIAFARAVCRPISHFATARIRKATAVIARFILRRRKAAPTSFACASTLKTRPIATVRIPRLGIDLRIWPYRIVFIHAASPGLRLAGGFFCLGNGARCDEFFPTAAKRGIKCDQLGDGIGFGDHKVVLARGKFAFGIKNGKVILFACIE